MIKDFSVLLTSISFSEERIFIRQGNNEKVTNKEIVSPKVIIQPKSIIGFIPLKTRERKAHIVVRAVYKIGSIIFLLAFSIASFFERSKFSLLIVKTLQLNEYSLPYLK